MTRIGLTLYLVLSTAVGPSLCCCLPGDLLALWTSSARQGCCGHHAASHSHRPAKTTQAPGTPSPAPEKDCPCKESQPQPVVLTPSEKSQDSESTRSLIAANWAAVDVSLLHAAPLNLLTQAETKGRCFAFPFRGARDVLSVLQVLRC